MTLSPLNGVPDIAVMGRAHLYAEVLDHGRPAHRENESADQAGSDARLSNGRTSDRRAHFGVVAGHCAMEAMGKRRVGQV